MILLIKMGCDITIKLVIDVGKKGKTFETILFLPFLVRNSSRLDVLGWPSICPIVLFLS